jgi:hypothetical protein
MCSSDYPTVFIAEEASHRAGSVCTRDVAVILPNSVKNLLQLIRGRMLVELESQ